MNFALLILATLFPVAQDAAKVLERKNMPAEQRLLLEMGIKTMGNTYGLKEYEKTKIKPTLRDVR